MIPFSYLLESNETNENMTYDLSGTVEQLSIGLLGSDEIEVKAVLAIRSFLKSPVEVLDITNISYEEIHIIFKFCLKINCKNM